MKNKISLGIASTFLLVTVAAFAANFTDDQLQFGKPGSSANKEIVFGASNKKKLKHVPGTLTLDYEGNNLSVGDGANTSDKTIKLNKGASSPTFRHNFTSGDLEIENAPVLNQKGNTLSVGDGANTNKVLKFNKGASSPEIRYNSSTGKLQFTNDTTTYKDIGSGSGGGGGTNLLQEVNFDFEAGTLNWTASGGTFTIDSATPLFGLGSGDWDASASGQTLSSPLVTIQRGFIGKKCTADVEYRWPSGVAGDISFQVVDQVPNILATVALEPTTGSNIRKAFLAFDCPTVATDQLRARLISNVTNPAVIDIDDVFVGVNKSTVNVTQASVWARARWLPNTNCEWNNSGGATVLSFFTDFPADTDCNNPSVFGQAVVPLTKVPRLRVANLPPGKYRLEAKGWHGNAGSNSATWTTTDGTNDGGDRIFSNSASGTFQGPVSGFFEYTTAQSNVEFRVVHQLTAGTGSGVISNFENTQNEHLYELVLYRYPTESAEALNLETTGWFVDANIGGGVAALGFANVPTYTEITNGSLDIVQNPGSAPVQIPCSGTNPSTGLTCSAGNEGLGVVVNIPYAGTYEVCGVFTHSIGEANTGSSGSAFTTFQWFETPNNAQTILQTGKTKTASGFDDSAASASVQINRAPHTNCGIFNFASAGQKTLRVMYEQTVGSAVTENNVIMDRNPAAGDIDAKITVRPYTQNFPAPVFTEVRNKMNAGVPNIVTRSGFVSCNPGPTFGQIGNWIQSVTYVSAGRCTVNFVSGSFSVAPYCTANINNGGTPNGFGVNLSPALTSMNLASHNAAGTGSDAGSFIICVGQQ